MKKILMFAFVSAVMLTIAGCSWCSEPQPGDPSCIEVSHHYDNKNKPFTTSMVTPNIAISREVFRPVFRAGAGRMTVVGSGDDREGATIDAISKFLAKASCDFIVSVSTVAVETIHPKPWWYIFCGRNRNWSVTLSGIPVYLDKLSVETMNPEKVDAYDAAGGLYLPSRGHLDDPKKAVRLPAPLPPLKAATVTLNKIPVRVAPEGACVRTPIVCPADLKCPATTQSAAVIVVPANVKAPEVTTSPVTFVPAGLRK